MCTRSWVQNQLAFQPYVIIVLHFVFLMLYKRFVVNWQAIQVTKRRVSVLTNLGKAMVCRWLRRGFS